MAKGREKKMKKEFDREVILNKLATPGPHEFIVVLDGLKPDFNIGKIFRTADAFGAREILLVNVEFFSPASAKGSMRHVPAKFFGSFTECHSYLRSIGYEIFVFEPVKGVDLDRAQLPRKSAFVLGHEEFGLSFDPDQFEGVRRLRIPQFGKVQSLNVSIAGSIVMYEYLRQTGGQGRD